MGAIGLRVVQNCDKKHSIHNPGMVRAILVREKNSCHFASEMGEKYGIAVEFCRNSVQFGH